MPNEFTQLVERLASSQTLLVVPHIKPDGDALGSAAALTVAARQAGKQAQTVLADPLPQRYAFVFGSQPPATLEELPALAAKADTIVVVDTCSYVQLDRLASVLREHRAKVVVIDHHVTSEVAVAPLRWIDTSATAAGVMIVEVVEALGWPIDEQASEAAATAIVSDTGWFRFSNTDQRALNTFRRLLDRGVRPDQLYRKLFQTDRLERLKLLGRVLGSMELHCDQRLAIMTIRRSDLAETAASMDETENMVNEALRLATVECAVMMTENPDGVTRVSLRSRQDVDVAQLAALFGGGGHARAAGLRSNLPVDELKAQLIDAFAKAMRCCG